MPPYNKQMTYVSIKAAGSIDLDEYIELILGYS